METAIAPSNPIVEIYGRLKEEEIKTFDQLKEKDKGWSDFGRSEWFLMVKEYVNSLVARLDDLEGEAFEKGASSDELAMRLAVKRLTKANLQSLIQKVERTTESVRGTK